MGIKPVHAMLGLVLVGGALSTGCRNDSGMVSENATYQSPMQQPNGGQTVYGNRPIANNQPIQQVGYQSNAVAGSNSASASSPVGNGGAYSAGGTIYPNQAGFQPASSNWGPARGAPASNPAVGNPGYPTGSQAPAGSVSQAPVNTAPAGFQDRDGFRARVGFTDGGANGSMTISAQTPDTSVAQPQAQPAPQAPTVDASGVPAGSTGGPVYTVPGTGAAMGPRSE
jgi:hypothetical protein